MQKINLIIQTILKLSHCKNGDENDNDDSHSSLSAILIAFLATEYSVVE